MKWIIKNKLSQFFIKLSRCIFLPGYVHARKQMKNMHIMSAEETVDRITKDKMSISRFGDGELNILLNDKGIGFQNYSPELKKKLSEVKASNKCMLGLPQGFKKTNDYKLFVSSFWWNYVVKNKKMLIKFNNRKGVALYADTNFSRVITELKNKEDIKRIIDKVKLIWNNKNVIIIEGVGTRFGIGNDLLNGSKKVYRIIAPGKNAFDEIDNLENDAFKVLDFVGYEETVVLLALGPTATILANRLSQKVQAIDIGHFDLQYEYLKSGHYEKVPIKDRYDNEMLNGDKFIDIKNTVYQNQICIDRSN